MTADEPSPISAPLREKISDGNGDVKQDAQDRTFNVLIRADAGRESDAESHAEDVCESVNSTYGGMINATVRGEDLFDLADPDAVRFVEENSDPKQHAISEGVADTNTDAVHDNGFTGAGETVAIIDIQFNPDNSDIQDSVVATIGAGAAYLSNSGLHGTACAEIVHDMAPDADLVLASVYHETSSGGVYSDIVETIDKIESQTEATVATMSLGFKQTLRLDGQDYISQRVSQFTGGGRVFSVSAGNEADGVHWDGEWTDTSGNGYMEFDDSGTEFFEVTTTNSGQEVVVQSDADWNTGQGYSIEVYDSNMNRISSPTRTTTPAQAVGVPGSSGSTTTSYIQISNESLDGDEHFDIFGWGNYIDFPVFTKSRSIGIPATSPDEQTLTTAAVNVSTNELEPFSSRGPTQDGRRGVDIAAPDAVTTIAYSGAFFGTSASAPHVGGAATLLMGLDGLDNEAIREALYATGGGISDGDVGPPVNRTIGHGYLDGKGGFDDAIGVLQHLSKSRGSRTQYASPAVDDQHVYVSDLGNSLTAYDRADGSVVWEETRDGALSDSSPYVDGSQVIVGNGGGTVVSYATADGSANWSTDVGSAVTSSPTVANGTVFVGANDGTVYGMSASNGDVDWSTNVGGPVYSDVAVAWGTVFVTTDDGSVVALDASTGNEDWRVDTGAEMAASSPAVDGNGDTVFVAADRVYALDRSSGSQNWSESYGGTVGASPALTSDTVYVGDANGTLHALDRGSGGSSWTFSANGPIAADPAAFADRVSVATTAGTLYVVETGSGDVLEQTSLPGETRSGLTVDGNDVYLGSRDGTFVGL